MSALPGSRSELIPGSRSELIPASRSELIIERLHALHPKLIDLSLGRMQRCLDALGNPERRLPPVIHVAGTNGKGSTCAFLRAIAEAAGQRVHVYTSPHLVRFHERIRLAGELVDEAQLSAALEHVERVNDGAPITVFEVTTAVALHLFATTPADLLVLEVGMGGRFDATNVVDAPVATAITSVSMDHMEFLGDTIARIAFEKAGIVKPGAPCVTGAQPAEALAVIADVAAGAGARLGARGAAWDVARAPTARSAGTIPMSPTTCRRPACPGRTRPTMPGSPSRRCAPGTRPGSPRRRSPPACRAPPGRPACSA
jgi:dihydrofolate synthase/folylpolyglutamate synthase